MKEKQAAVLGLTQTLTTLFLFLFSKTRSAKQPYHLYEGILPLEPLEFTGA